MPSLPACRGRWLLGLLILQSTSSFVLDSYSDLLRDHLVVTLFLTMLVGAGGNAGNQSAIKVIRGLVSQSVGGWVRDRVSQRALPSGSIIGGWSGCLWITMQQ
jgi:Mg/Co/Ni transporter MgtE